MAEIGADLAPARMFEIGRQPEPNRADDDTLANTIGNFMQQT